MWSAVQLYQLMNYAEPINIFVDNDQVGLRSAKILQNLFHFWKYECKTFISTKAKDASEHFDKLKLDWNDVEEIDITNDLINSYPDQTFNFTDYLKNRTF
jgi:hypothetical protein